MTDKFYADPVHRDWIYDGYGIKRYKDNYAKVVDTELCKICNKVKMYSECNLFCCNKNKS